jgi:2-C-methyl-D-erythritol 4-phosphate cytidylyltransferase
VGKTYAIVTAAGSGRRLGSKIPKQYLSLAGKPLVVYSLETLNNYSKIDGIVLVVGAGWEDTGYRLKDQYEITKLTAVVTGGSTRQASVYRGLQALPENTEIVLIHDAARPFITGELIGQMVAAARRTGAAAPALPVKDTIKVADSNGLVHSSPDRSCLFAVQTPQSFVCSIILEAHEKAAKEGFTGTDDAMLVEWMSLPVELVVGDEQNIKITTSLDLKLAELLVRK